PLKPWTTLLKQTVSQGFIFLLNHGEVSIED
ncbi:unnamed protein product, partial [marine sediment metagenome]